MKYETIVTRLTVRPVGEPIFAYGVTHVELADEAAGEFVTLRQCRDDSDQFLKFEKEEWPTVRDAVDKIVEIANNACAGDRQNID